MAEQTPKREIGTDNTGAKEIGTKEIGTKKIGAKQIGEGNYEASREYDEKAREYVENNGSEIASKAKQAADALDGPEAEALQKAEAEGKSHARH